MEGASNPYDLIIIGGGAAGFFAAGNALPNARILILEKARQPLGKILISGGGRCNVTHACFDPWRLVENYPRGSAALRSAFTHFQPWDTMRWFEARGVPLKIEEDGRVFPSSNDSKTIANCLRLSAEDAGVELRTQSTILNIEHLAGVRQPVFRLQVESHPGVPEKEERSERESTTTLYARQILLATGGDPRGMALAASLGHTIVPPVPSLFTFNSSDLRLEGLSGLSFSQARVRLHSIDRKFTGIESEGALLITHWGLSGPAVLKCSAWGARWLYEQGYRAILEINWLHPHSLEETLSTLRQFKAHPANQKKIILTNNPLIMLPLRLWQRLVIHQGITDQDQWANLSKVKLLRLAEELCTGLYEITGKGSFKEEFVTCGGVKLDEVDFRTMESKLVPGVYFAGEVLDIDGLTGGFNFQSAWTTAFLAMRAINEKISSAPA